MRPPPWFVVLVLAAFCSASLPVLPAQPYPDKPVRLLVPFEPGGTVDVLTRIIAPLMAEDLGRPLVVENRWGGGGVVGTRAAVRAVPDGYTLVVGSAALATQAIGKLKLPYDAASDLEAVASFATAPCFVFVNAASPAGTIADLITLARRSPERLAYASSGTGSSAHLAGAEFGLATGTRLLHVPYRGTGPAVNDLIAGQVDMLFAPLPTTATYLRFTRLKALAVAAPARVSLLPEVPTVAEAGGPEFSVSSWIGILAPRGTPDAVKTRLAGSVHRALRDPAVAWRFAMLGALPLEQSVEQFEAAYAADFERQRRLVREHPWLLD
jgi:tripartite-type tricarboxylate transporter receptor subunit TctC